jgi:hypothetical protein
VLLRGISQIFAFHKISYLSDHKKPKPAKPGDGHQHRSGHGAVGCRARGAGETHVPRRHWGDIGSIWISFSGWGTSLNRKACQFWCWNNDVNCFLTQNNCATQPWPYTKVFVCRLWVWRQLQLWGLPLIPRKYWMFVRCWNAGSVLKWLKHHVIIQW